MATLIRTNSNNIDFVNLVNQLDTYLKIVDGDDHPFYDQFNNIDALKHVVIAYVENKPVGCGAFKKYDNNSAEIKRMFTLPESRGKGVANKILNALELWAIELKYKFFILETGQRQVEAINFYKKLKYEAIPNYGQYKNIENSLCFQKKLT